MPNTNQYLIDSLEKLGVLRSRKIKEALSRFPREQFVPAGLRHSAYEDHPLPIGEGQTISQPYTVVFMLEQLDVRKSDNVLEIGAGSGWQTALLSYLVGSNSSPPLRGGEGGGVKNEQQLGSHNTTPRIKYGAGSSPSSRRRGVLGHVWAYEINSKVADFGKANLAPWQAQLKNVHYLVGDATRRAMNHAPYDRIIAGAAFAEIPKELIQLLKIGGRLVAPTQIGPIGDIRVIVRKGNKEALEMVYQGFSFVPITHK